MPYIDMINDIKSMPDTIQVLLVAKHSGKVYAQNSPFETIYVKGPNGNFDFVGKYVAETLYGEDALLQYRKYKKVIHQKTDIPLCFQAMNDPSQKGVFYHANMFVDIQTITDDKDFEQRVLLIFKVLAKLKQFHLAILPASNHRNIPYIPNSLSFFSRGHLRLR